MDERSLKIMHSLKLHELWFQQ